MIRTETRKVTLTNCRAVCGTCGDECFAGMNERHAHDLAMLAGWESTEASKDGQPVTVYTCHECQKVKS